MEWLNRKGCWLRGFPPPARRGASRGENLLLETGPPSSFSPFPAVDVCVCVRRGGESGEKKPCLFAVVCTGGILFALLLYEAARFQFGVSRSVWEICVQQHPFAGDKRELRGEKRGGETVSSFLHGRAKTKTTSKPEAANLLFSTMCWIDNCSFFSPSIPPSLSCYVLSQGRDGRHFTNCPLLPFMAGYCFISRKNRDHSR